MKSQVLHAIWCYISGKAAEFWKAIDWTKLARSSYPKEYYKEHTNDKQMGAIFAVWIIVFGDNICNLGIFLFVNAAYCMPSINPLGHTLVELKTECWTCKSKIEHEAITEWNPEGVWPARPAGSSTGLLVAKCTFKYTPQSAGAIDYHHRRVYMGFRSYSEMVPFFKVPTCTLACRTR